METCKYGSGAGKRKPTAVKRKGVVCRAYELGASIFVGGTAGIFRKGLTLEQSIAQFLMSIQ